MKIKEKVFEVLSEGGDLTIWRIQDRKSIHFIYDHSEFDPSESGLGVNKTIQYNSFKKPFRLIHKRYDCHNQHLEFVHDDYKKYIANKLVKKLNQLNIPYWEINSQNQLEKALGGYLYGEFDKETDKANWSFFPKLISNNTGSELLEELIKATGSIDPEIKSYFVTYPYFLSYFDEKPDLSIHDIVIGISFTYSWMPTVLKSIDLSQEDALLRILNRAKQGDDLNEKDLKFLKSVFNNSLVGTSKLLHFINPDKFAIWDSKVFRNLCKEAPHKYKLEKPELYLSYLRLLLELKEEPYFGQFHKLMVEKVGYSVTPLRALELGFYHMKP